MELFINQGKDSTVEPGYLAEMGSKSNVTPSPSPEPETFEVTIIFNSDDHSRLPFSSGTCNHTYTEVISAIQNNKKIIGSITFNNIEGITCSTDIEHVVISDFSVADSEGQWSFSNAVIFYGKIITLESEGISCSLLLMGLLGLTTIEETEKEVVAMGFGQLNSY